MASYAEQTRGDIGLSRGTEGEAVADPRGEPQQRIWIGGQLQADLSGDPAGVRWPRRPTALAIAAATTHAGSTLSSAGRRRLRTP